MSLIPIKQYRDFWDFPRIFLVTYRKTLLLFDCRFNEETEDYEDEFQIFSMPRLDDEELKGSWRQLSDRAIKFIGRVLVENIKFDESKRKFIDDVFLKGLINT
jgi:hypothetical protein